MGAISRALVSRWQAQESHAGSTESRALHPNLARTQTVLGFAFLTQTKVREAQQAFARAIELDQAAPLPRLGLGLAEIRQGDLHEGRGEIAIAASLDPNNSLVRATWVRPSSKKNAMSWHRSNLLLPRNLIRLIRRPGYTMRSANKA